MRAVHKIDATQGSILKNLILFAVPIAIGSLVMTLFNAADMMVLGNFADSTAVASVGATSVITTLVVHSAVGLSAGTQVVLAQAIGEKNSSKIRKAVDTSLLLAFFLGIVLVLVGLFCSRWFLTVTKCPSECIDDAALYLKIYIASSPAFLVYNYGAAIIRASGESRRPLYYIIASGALNVILNFILCFVMQNKVAAVAIATFASQVLGAFLVIYYLIKTDDECKVIFRQMRFDFGVLKKILFIGIPSAINVSLFSISNLQIQSAINSFGPSAIAGNTSASNIEGLVSSFASALSSATLTFMGQNIGAKNRERIRLSLAHGLWTSLTTGMLGLGFFALGRPILSLYLPSDAAAVEVGLLRMKFVLAIFALAAYKCIIATALQAFGYAFIPTCNSILSVLVLRIIWMAFIYPHFQSLENLYFCYTVSWIIESVIATTAFIIIYRAKMNKKNFISEKAVI